MKINDVLNEGFYDNPSTSNATGQKYFIDSVTKQLNAFIDSSRKSGQPVKIWDFVQSYLTKYGWVANPEQTTMLKKLASDVEAEYNVLQKQPEPTPASSGEKAFGQMANQLTTAAGQKQSSNAFGQMASQLAPQQQKNWAPNADSPAVWKSNRTGKPMKEGIGDYFIHKAGNLMTSMGLGSVNKLAHAMYSVGMTQHRDPRTGQVMTGKMQGQEPDDTKVDPAGQQVINSVKKLKGEQYEKDLQEIIKLALWNLHGADKEDYSTFVNQIMKQKSTAKNPVQQQQKPTS